VRKQCAVCQVPFEAKRAAAKYCSPRCRVRATRARAAGLDGGAAAPPEPSPAVAGGVEAAAVAELAAAGRLGTSGGQSALVLARRIDTSAATEMGAGLAALVKQFGVTLAEAVKGGQVAVNPLDELKAKRDRRAAG
jgi:hypothetical protein